MATPSMYSLKSQSDVTILSLLVLLSIFFLFVVSLGWYWLLRAVTHVPLIAGMFAILITAIAFLIARFIGRRKYEAQYDDVSPSSRWKRNNWIILYPFLFFLSAMGTINLAFYNFEGPSVLQSDMDRARSSLTALSNTAHQALFDPAFEAKKSRVNALMDQLGSEILNPSGRNSCGVGPEAEKDIERLRELLPNFAEISWDRSLHKCGAAQLRDIYEDYRRRAYDMLNQDTEYVNNRGPEKVGYLSNLDHDINLVQADLRDAEVNIGSRLSNNRSDGFANAQRSLEEAKDRYETYRYRLDQFAPGRDRGLSASLDISSSQVLGSIATIIPTLIGRFRHWTTYLYIFVAVLLDLGLVFLFAEQAKQRKKKGVIVVPVENARDPSFLWVNPY